MMLMKQLRVANPRLSSKAREKALAVAREWKEKLVSDNANTLVALGFFHLVAAFGLVSEFGVEELVDYSAAAAVNEEFLELCRITGLTDRVPGKAVNFCMVLWLLRVQFDVVWHGNS